MSKEEIVAITMPKWGLSMTEGKVMEWLVEEGAVLQVGDAMVDIETEKIVPIVIIANIETSRIFT